MSHKVADIIKEKFIEALEKDAKPIWRSPYVGNHTAINRVSKKPYKGINVFFLCGEYASYKQWSELGYKCEKGKSEIAYFYTCKWYHDKDENGNLMYDKKGNPIERSAWILRFYQVWERHNVRDENGNIAPSIYGDDENIIDDTPPSECEQKAMDVMHKYIADNGFIYTVDLENKAYFVPATNVIHMPKEMVSENARVCTLAHECAHSTGADFLLNRKMGGYRNGKESYSKEELIAETASALFCAEHGVSVDTDNTTAYLAGWAKYLKETPAQTILTAIYQAQKAVRLMNGESLEKVKNSTENKGEVDNKPNAA